MKTQTYDNLVLVIGPVGAGKTSTEAAAKAAGWLTFSEDMIKSFPVDAKLHELRRERRWIQHNAIWYPMLWGGLAAAGFPRNQEPMIFFDHGGWCLLDDRLPHGIVPKVIIRFNISTAVLHQRLAKANADQSRRALVNFSAGSTRGAWDMWKRFAQLKNMFEVSPKVTPEATWKAMQSFLTVTQRPA